MRDPVRVGSTGRLRVQFFDAALLPIQASNVTVDLFAPGLDPDTATPTAPGLIPTYLGNGVFELLFTGGTPAGQWIDRWTGDILGTATTAIQRFSIIDSGIIASYSIHGLFENTLVEVIVSGDIADISGNPLGDDLNFLFTTTYNPLYSSVRKVKLDAGGMLGSIPDDTINLAILEASIEADVLSFRGTVINQNVFTHARRQYVTCLAAMGLSQNVLANGGVIKSKALADFKVDYDVNILGDLLGRLNDCIKKWETQLQSGGGARTIRNPKLVIRGELDPDRPSIGKMWHSLNPGELPIANTKSKSWGSRRWRSGWLSGPRRGGSGEW